MAPYAIDVIDIRTWEMSRGSVPVFDFVQFSNAVLDIAKNCGKSALSASPLPSLIATINSKRLTWSQVSRVFERASQESWGANWSSMFLSLALECSDFPVADVISFWKDKECRISPVVADESAHNAINVLLPIAANGDLQEALFGAELLCRWHRPLDRIVGNPMLERCVVEFRKHSNSKIGSRFADALLAAPLPDSGWELLAEPSFYINEVSRRFVAAHRISGDQGFDGALEGMPIKYVDRIIEDRLKFPHEVVMAAAQRSIAVRGSLLAAIDDSVWRDG